MARPEIIAYNDQVNNDITTQSTPDSIPPFTVGSAFTELALLIDSLLDGLNVDATLGSAAPTPIIGGDGDFYFRLSGSNLELFKKVSGTWISRGSGTFGLNFENGPIINLRSKIEDNILTITRGQWIINGLLYGKATQTQFLIPTADINFERRDLIYLNESNQIIYVTGVASVTPVEPTLPPNTALYDYVIVPPSVSNLLPFLLFNNDNTGLGAVRIAPIYLNSTNFSNSGTEYNASLLQGVNYTVELNGVRKYIPGEDFDFIPTGGIVMKPGREVYEGQIIILS